MEMKIEKKEVNGSLIDYLYFNVGGIWVCIGYVDHFGRLHIKN